MNSIGWGFAIVGVAMFVFAWLFYLRYDIRRWLRERGPRQQMIREEREAREQELARLREELAAKYLASGQPKQSDSGTTRTGQP
jgi:hypothetical protein